MQVAPREDPDLPSLSGCLLSPVEPVTSRTLGPP
jgi:hypothetical protein